MIILKKGLPSIKAVCRENRYTVREYEFKEDAKAKGEAVKAKLIAEEHAARVRDIFINFAGFESSYRCVCVCFFLTEATPASICDILFRLV